MKAILEFNLPEDDHEFQQACAASNAFLALWDMQQYLRDQRKYVEPEDRDEIPRIEDRFREILTDRDLFGILE